MVLIFAQTPPIPGEPESPWEGMSCEWVGADGSVWDLGSGAEGVALQAGVEGLHNPPVTAFSSTSRGVPGKRRRGSRVEAREVFWPVSIQGSSAVEWRDRYTRFFRSIHPDTPGTWRVGVGGSYRELTLTGVFDDSHRVDTDPNVFGWDVFGVTLEAAQPFWTGSPVTRGPWATPDPVDFFDAGAPPFNISKSETFGSASIDNPGDVEAYPVWTITGPISDAAVGVGDKVIDVPFTVDDGEVLVIDTDPRNVTATLDGVDVTATLGFQRFAPVQPGESVAVHVEGTGGGTVTCSLVPLYFRAY